MLANPASKTVQQAERAKFWAQFQETWQQVRQGPWVCNSHWAASKGPATFVWRSTRHVDHPKCAAFLLHTSSNCNILQMARPTDNALLTQMMSTCCCCCCVLHTGAPDPECGQSAWLTQLWHQLD